MKKFYLPSSRTSFFLEFTLLLPSPSISPSTSTKSKSSMFVFPNGFSGELV